MALLRKARWVRRVVQHIVREYELIARCLVAERRHATVAHSRIGELIVSDPLGAARERNVRHLIPNEC